VITGRVTQADGLPVAAMTMTVSPKPAVRSGFMGGVTDANGVFRIAHLRPGTYSVSTNPRDNSGKELPKTIVDSVVVETGAEVATVVQRYLPAS
jgi:hypothetical protein